MRKRILTSLLLGGLVWGADAQVPAGSSPNMIPNPSFEEVAGKRPKDDISGAGIFRQNVQHWKSPTKSTPDLKIVLPHEISQAKKSGKTIDEPHTGRMMAAILTDNQNAELPQKNPHTYREYLQVKLDRPTRKGQEYYYEFWVCRAYMSKFITNNLGIVLSPTPVYRQGPDGWEPILDIKPDVNHTEIVNKDGRKWVRISGTLTSANRSEYFILGNFFDLKNTKVEEAADLDPAIENPFENAYYLIDDVALHELNYKEDPPEPEPEPEVLVKEEEIEVGKAIQLDRVFFETSKWALLSESTEQLDKLVDLLNKYPTMEIEIHGHTDSRGSDSSNQTLSENRTRSVYEYLLEQGIEESRLGYVGYGEEKPIADNDTAEGRQMNRRVEFVVTKIDKDVKVEHSNTVKPNTDRS
ncbi:MAG: OmpA family protein [Saprospiraceae bacterium]|nr:OmpA family protein [Saprospiraceae bacterium]